MNLMYITQNLWQTFCVVRYDIALAKGNAWMIYFFAFVLATTIFEFHPLPCLMPLFLQKCKIMFLWCQYCIPMSVLYLWYQNFKVVFCKVNIYVRLFSILYVRELLTILQRKFKILEDHYFIFLYLSINQSII